MPDLPERPLPPVLAAMAAMDEAVAAHKLLIERLAGAREKAEHLEEDLRRVDRDDHATLIATARSLALAMTRLQKLAWQEERARVAVSRSQAALDEVRRSDRRSHAERLRIELEIDAASIWDMVGRFEAELRARLEAHAQTAAEMEFAARAGGADKLLPPPASALTPPLAASGPDFWHALASGVQHLQELGTPLPPVAAPPQQRFDPLEATIRSVSGERVDKPEVVRPRSTPPEVVPLASPAEAFFVPARQDPAPAPSPLGRIERALRALARTADTEPPPTRKKSRA